MSINIHVSEITLFLPLHPPPPNKDPANTRPRKVWKKERVKEKKERVNRATWALTVFLADSEPWRWLPS